MKSILREIRDTVQKYAEIMAEVSGVDVEVADATLFRVAGTGLFATGVGQDMSREGYTYLLPPNQKHSAAPGDDKGMAAARREFLSKRY